MARHQIDQKHFTAKCLDNLTSDHLLARVISPLDQDSWLDPRDELFWRVLIKHNHQIDGLERRQNLCPGLDRLDWTAWTLQPCHRPITIEANHKPVACGARGRQQFDVTWMQQIEAAVRESNPQTLLAPFSKCVIKYIPVEKNLLFRCQPRRRQNS